MDQVTGQAALNRRSLTLRERPLARPFRFDPQQLVETRPKNVVDDNAQQLAAAMQRAREEGLRLARNEVDAALEAHETARRELLRVTRLLSAAVEQLAMRDQDDLTAIEEQAVLFGTELAEELVGRELQTSDDELAAAMRRAIGLVPDRGPFALRVHPGDAAAVGESLAQRPEHADRVDVIADASVEPSGCVAVVGALRIDGQLGAALERVRDVVRAL